MPLNHHISSVFQWSNPHKWIASVKRKCSQASSTLYFSEKMLKNHRSDLITAASQLLTTLSAKVMMCCDSPWCIMHACPNLRGGLYCFSQFFRVPLSGFGIPEVTFETVIRIVWRENCGISWHLVCRTDAPIKLHFSLETDVCCVHALQLM